ncbi:MAG: hypothetical protein WAR41_07655 [Azonexus sp.]
MFINKDDGRTQYLAKLRHIVRKNWINIRFGLIFIQIGVDVNVQRRGGFLPPPGGARLRKYRVAAADDK